ncbi:MAG: flavin reductase family protein [Firmicutes bacterium]|nr:flavin reductase family protein [Bacillota bacterium]
MFRDIPYDTKIQQAINAISSNGAFLTVGHNGTKNTMTIGWASIGFFWGKPIMTVAVRDSRYTYELIEKAADFTVSIPFEALQEALHFCGTKSGRDRDKFTECGLTAQPGRRVNSPVIAECDLHYECQIVFKTKMNPDLLAESCQKWYPKKDYHTFYFGEIVACYERE